MLKKTALSAAVLAGMLNIAPAMADQQTPETDNINDVPAGNYTIDPLHSKITWRRSLKQKVYCSSLRMTASLLKRNKLSLLTKLK